MRKTVPSISHRRMSAQVFKFGLLESQIASPNLAAVACRDQVLRVMCASPGVGQDVVQGGSAMAYRAECLVYSLAVQLVSIGSALTRACRASREMTFVPQNLQRHPSWPKIACCTHLGGIRPGDLSSLGMAGGSFVVR
jgi:hypothetical protein